MQYEVEGEGTVRYSGKVDVFSFGVLLCQCWTGLRPYDEVRGPVWKVQRHILGGGRPRWHARTPEEGRKGRSSPENSPGNARAQTGQTALVVPVVPVVPVAGTVSPTGSPSDTMDPPLSPTLRHQPSSVGPDQTVEEAVIALASRCWAHEPDLRPTFHQIAEMLIELEQLEQRMDRGTSLISFCRPSEDPAAATAVTATV